MRYHIFTWGLVLGAAAAAAQGPAGDPGPAPGALPLGVRLDRVTCAEAVAALRAASRLPIQLRSEPAPRPSSGQVAARLEARFSFDWRNASAGEALDTLGQRYGLAVWTGPAGVLWLVPAEDPRECRLVRPVGLVETDGLRIGVSRAVIHTATPARPFDEQLHLGLDVRPLSRDEHSLAVVENVTAVDDRGRVLRDRDMLREAARPQARPGRCWFGITLPAPHPEATRLVSVQGDVLAYRRFSRHRIEMPLPVRRGQNRWREGDLGFELLAVRSRSSPAPVAAEGPVPAGPVVVGRLSFPPGIELGKELSTPGLGGFPYPLLIGASGRLYPGVNARGTPSAVAGQEEHARELEWRFPRIDEPLTRLELHLLRREAPERVATFRLRDLPLPRSQRTEPAGTVSLHSGRLADGHSLFRRGGAELVSPVRIGNRPAPPGVLYFGLTPQAALGVSGSEWFAAPVSGGMAALAGLRPGTYRLLRLYRSETEDPGGLVGAWQGAELSITVPPQGKVRLPALRLQQVGALTPPAKVEAARPMDPAPAAGEQPGVSVSEVRVALAEERSVQFFERPEFRHSGSTRLIVSGMTAPEFSDRLAHAANLVARDDRGRLFTAANLPVNQSHRLWNAGWALPLPGAGVKRLDWIEGEFHCWSRVEPLNIEIPLTPWKPVFRRQEGPVRIEFTLAPGEADDELREAAPAHEKGLRVSGFIAAPPTVQLEAPEGKRFQLVLIGASGASYAIAGGSSGLERGGKGTHYRIDGQFPALTELAVKLRIELVLKSELRKAASFRVTDIRLPEGDPLRERPPGAPASSIQVPVAKVALPVAAPAPYRAARGGRLALPVRLGRKLAGGGTLSLGLTRKESGGREALRWIDLPVSTEGLARLEDLRPGTYHVVRRYRPARPDARLAGGRWSRAEVQVRVEAGKTVLLPPLQWLPRP